MTTHFDRTAQDRVDRLKVDGREDARRGALYQASQQIEDAVNAALILNRPLLVSGEPGCGKTELGFAIARKLGIPDVWFFPVKSDSEAARLFYEYDAVRRFHDTQIRDARSTDPRNYITYRALGRAILDMLPAGELSHMLLEKDISSHPAEPRRSVVIIDEIDKAPRDFPNDLLNELDQMWFRVPELAGEDRLIETPTIAPDHPLRPIIVITSNIEKQLPDAFLRRCVFCSVDFPQTGSEGVLLRDIIAGHLEREARQPSSADIEAAIRLVAELRDPKQDADKRPGLSELLEFLRGLARLPAGRDAESFKARALTLAATLAKTENDRKRVLNALKTLEVPGLAADG